MRILIVEDNNISSKIMERILSGYGECVTVNNGEEAVAIINNNGEEAVAIRKNSIDDNNYFDLVFLDIMKIPNGDGKMVLSNIRTLEEENQCETRARIIMTSSLDNE